MLNFNIFLLVKNFLIKNTANKLWILSIMTILMYVFGVYYALFISPADYLQGEMVRIMYVHVPAAWMGLLIYTAMAVTNVFSIIYNAMFARIVSYALAPIGACFTLICLITGSIWGHPVWGTWWVWDARLTSMLILFFLYIGYMMLWDNQFRSSHAAATFNILGAINIPIIKFSVNIWNTLHQPASIIRRGGIAIDSAMLLPLGLLFAASICFTTIVCILRTTTLMNAYKAQRYD